MKGEKNDTCFSLCCGLNYINSSCFPVITDHIFLELLKFHLQFMCPALSDSDIHQWTLCVWRELNSAGNSLYGKHFKRKAKFQVKRISCELFTIYNITNYWNIHPILHYFLQWSGHRFTCPKLWLVLEFILLYEYLNFGVLPQQIQCPKYLSLMRRDLGEERIFGRENQ